MITIVDTSIRMNKEELNNYVQKYSLLKIQKVLEGENLIEKKVGSIFLSLSILNTKINISILTTFLNHFKDYKAYIIVFNS